MVQYHFLWKKRYNDDFDNLDFIQDPIPIGVSPLGIPIFREITDPTFVTQPFTTNNYKQLNTQDIYGMYMTILNRPGVRKVNNFQMNMTVEQKSSKFQIPSVAISFQSVRPGFWDQGTGTFTPLFDYFLLDPNMNCVDENIRKELTDNSLGSIWDTLNGVGVLPDQIDLTGGGVYRKFPLLDFANYNGWEHITTTEISNKIYTTHKLASPILLNTPDVNNFPGANAIQVKFQFYTLFPEYLDATSNTPDPILTLLDSDSIASLTGHAEII